MAFLKFNNPAVVVAAACLLCACQRQHRDIRPAPASLAIYGGAAPEDALRPGGPVNPQPVVNNPYNASAYDISEGARLFQWYNCAGCHANGGGGIGPPLIKQHWIYGGEPANLFDTIVKGRPNGMPTWGGRIPAYQIWEIVAYVRSLNGEQPRSATAARQDTIQQNPQTIVNRTNGQTK
ncbi:MAG TPA: c-type cytochrome [Bryobacteraceae bacterium]|nr:c-type cytochrome [Bryobacteraceae bacterium]